LHSFFFTTEPELALESRVVLESASSIPTSFHGGFCCSKPSQCQLPLQSALIQLLLQLFVVAFQAIFQPPWPYASFQPTRSALELNEGSVAAV
jgi:hypothetical protein